MKKFLIVPIFFYLLGQASAACTEETSALAAIPAEVKETRAFLKIPIVKFLRCLENLEKSTETSTGLNHQNADDEVENDIYVWCLETVTPRGTRLSRRPNFIFGNSEYLANI